MKKHLSKKLLLNKVTVVSLESGEMKYAKGGNTHEACTIYTDYFLCTHPAGTCSPE
jgi:natural product precursor